MCTLSIVRYNNQIIITSNRDDNPRRNATEIKKITFNNIPIYYPKDKLTDGTWLAFNGTGGVAILLNGGDNKHKKQPHHQISRGIIPIDFLKKNIGVEQFEKSIDFYPFEPFTLVVYKNQTTATLKWNGDKTAVKTFNNQQNQMIWSSTTLYNPYVREQRHQLFKNHFNNKPLTASAIFELLSTPTNDLQNGFYIKRPLVQTLSTSQLIINNHEIVFKHRNHLINNETTLNHPILNELVKD